MTDKRRGWLAELEAGDLVIIEYPRSSSTVKKVDKITPTGITRTCGGDPTSTWQR